jgi:hypothetical protein
LHPEGESNATGPQVTESSRIMQVAFTDGAPLQVKAGRPKKPTHLVSSFPPDGEAKNALYAFFRITLVPRGEFHQLRAVFRGCSVGFSDRCARYARTLPRLILERTSRSPMSVATHLLADTLASTDDSTLLLAFGAGLFGILTIAFLYAALRCRRAEALAPPPPPPLQLLFNHREQVVSDGQGGKTISVTVKNTTNTRTLTGIDVRLKALEALHKERLNAPQDWPSLQLPLSPTGVDHPQSPADMCLAPGESVSYLVAKAMVGDCYLYLLHGNSSAMVAPDKVTLAPYLATITATALDTPGDAMALELPTAGRGLGVPRARHLTRS